MKTKKYYLQNLPKRIFKVWIQFAITVCLFLLLNIFTGKVYSISTIILSFTAWDSVGNSNWYILAILVLYALSYIGAILTCQNNLKTTFFVTAGCCIYIIVMIMCQKESWYYNTISCYPLGTLFAIYEHKIRMLLEKRGTYLMLIASLTIAFVTLYICAMKSHGVIWLATVELREIFFVLLIFLATSRIRIVNLVLNWLGQHTFEIYILQRLPIIVLSETRLNQYVFFLYMLLSQAWQLFCIRN